MPKKKNVNKTFAFYNSKLEKAILNFILKHDNKTVENTATVFQNLLAYI